MSHGDSLTLRVPDRTLRYDSIGTRETADDAAHARAFSILHLSQSVGRRSFGVGTAALSLGDAQREIGCLAENWSADTAQELAELRQEHSTTDDIGRSCRFGSVCGFERYDFGRWPYAPHMHQAVAGSRGASFDILHQHSIWSPCSLATRRWRQRHGRPTVISPQGALDPWALRKSRLKKWAAGVLYERSNLAQASCIHAVSASEVMACRAYGLRNPVAHIPNGVSQSWIDSRGDAERFRETYNISSGKRIALFLSRVTPKKGLAMLFKAISDVGHSFDDWLLVVAGPDEFGHTQELAELAQKLDITSAICFTGPLYGEDRRDAFDAAELFVLPTYGEGHPLALLEALGTGLPALTTTGAYCDFIPAQQCGWQTDVSVAAVREGLLTAIACNGGKLTEMGKRGQRYVAENLTWNAIARQTVLLYDWLLGNGSHPDFVNVL